MVPSRSPTPIPFLRVAVEKAVERTSLRAVAQSVGMSATSVHKFIQGSEPGPSIARRLSAWYARMVREQPFELTEGAARAALALLVEPVAPDEREEVRRTLLNALAEEYRATRTELPEWLEEAMRGD